jgi:hypothetical protein
MANAAPPEPELVGDPVTSPGLSKAGGRIEAGKKGPLRPETWFSPAEGHAV